MSIAATVLLGVLGAGMGLAVPGSPAAAAGGTMSPTTDLSANGADAFNPQVGVDASGRAISVWERDGVIQTRWSSDGGVTWSTAVDLTSRSDSDSFTPRLSVDASGRAIAVWRAQANGGNAIQTRSSSDGGVTWSPVVNLAQSGRNLFNPRVSVNSEGKAIAVWVSTNKRQQFTVQANSSSDGGATWTGTTVDLTDPVSDIAIKPQVSIDSSGRVIALWEHYDGSNLIVQSKTSANGGVTWSGPVNLSTTGENVDKPRLSIDGANRAVAVWTRGNIVQSRSSTDAGLTWSTVVDLSAIGRSAQDPEVSIDGSGRTIAIWSGQSSDMSAAFASIVQTRSSTDGGLTWSAAVDLSGFDVDASDPEVTIDGAGRAVAAWSGYDGFNYAISTRASTDGGLTWSTSVVLSEAEGDAYSPQLTANSSGRVFIVWEHSGWSDSYSVSQTRSYLFPAALADTGANDSVIGASAAASAGLFAAGALALAIRRRLARS
jgi:hypothetical protein